jgi:hypothetical protein
MFKRAGLFSALVLLLATSSAIAQWNPPAKVSLDEIVATSKAVLAMPDIKTRMKEEVIRIRALEMDWDIGAMTYEPEDASKILKGPDGRKAGAFLLHGGSGDYRAMEPIARLLTGKFGFKVVAMTYPGNLYLLDPSRNWPGETGKRADGSVRTPIWNKDKLITRDQYDVIEDKEVSRRKRWGTLILARAKEGTEFYNRMAGWPVAFEEGAKELMRRFLPEHEYSIYGDGHSTGGPFTFMLSQRVPNFVGVIGMETSTFGYMYGKNLNAQGISDPWPIPFNCLRINSWRDSARYIGFEALEKEGGDALKRLAMLMEEVLEASAKESGLANFKAENIIHFYSPSGLTEAARATAKRLKMSAGDTEALVQRYLGYTRELSGPGVRPVPPTIMGIAKASRDHSPKTYNEIYLPMFAAMKPAPKVKVVQFDAGTHGYMAPEPNLPMGVAPAAVKMWYDAIMGGYFKQVSY